LKLFRKQPKSPYYKAATKRAKNMAKGELLDWLETTQANLVTSVNEYRRVPIAQTAEEIAWAAHAMAALADELVSRYRTQ
jgi:hypothetical protein